MAALPVYVINLDRRPDRRAFMEQQLDAIGVAWERVSAVDAETVSDARIAREIALDGHLIRMGRGSQCCTLSHLDLFRRIADASAPAAVVMEDDIELSPDIALFVRDAEWVPGEVGLVRFEKWSRRETRKLLGRPFGRSPAPGRALHRLYSRIGGSGCYLISQEAAKRILAGKGILRYPIDHLLFNINISPLAREVGVAMVAPCLARQVSNRFASDISPSTQARRRSLGDRLRRLRYEVNLAPAQLAAMVGGARVVEVAFAERTG